MSHTKPQAGRELLQNFFDLSVVPIVEVGQTIANYQPVQWLAGDQHSQSPTVQHRNGIAAGADDFTTFGVQSYQDIEVQEAVVHRRNQMFGQDVAHTR